VSTLLDMYRIRQDDEKTWDTAAIEGSVTPEFAANVLSLLPANGEKLAGNAQSILPSPLFPRLEALCRLYLNSSPEQRLYLRSRLDFHSAGQIEFFGTQSAVLAMRTGSEEQATLAVVAFAISEFRSGDVRDVLMSLSGVHHAITRAGFDANALFNRIALTSGPAGRDLLEGFARRHPDLQSLRMMGLHEVETPEGPGLASKGPRPAGSASK